MPEYLAPDVYVEEIDTGSKPIEGVSTSTAGFVGVAERGPVDVPILVTSFGEYNRWFGETLNPADYPNHCFMPHAVEGFFTNGGKRLYVVRVINSALADRAHATLFRDDTVTPAASTLLGGSTTGAKTIVALDGSGFTAANKTVQIGDGSTTEYGVTDTFPAANDITLRMPLEYGYQEGAAATTVDHFAPAALVVQGGAAAKLEEDVKPGATTIRISGPGTIAAGQLLRLGTDAAGDDEYMFAAAPPAASSGIRDVVLSTPVALFHAGGAGQAVDVLDPLGAPADTTFLVAPVHADESVLFLNNRTNFTTAGHVVRIGGGGRVEVRRIGELSQFALGVPTYDVYPVGAIVEAVDMPLEATMRKLTADAKAGNNYLELDNIVGLKANESVIQIGKSTDAQREYLTVTSIPAAGGAATAGKVLLSAPLQFDRNKATAEIYRVTSITRKTPGTTATAIQAARGSASLIAGRRTGYAPLPAYLRVWASPGTAYYHFITAAPTVITPKPITLKTALNLPHSSGEPLILSAALFDVFALDAGDWGNRLRVAVHDSDPPLVRTTIRTVLDSTHLRLVSANGIEAGTVLERTDAAGVVVGTYKVTAVERQSDFLITVDTTTPLGGAAVGDAITSREFQLNVLLLRQRDPAVPTRSDTVLATENFPHLSMDPRHSRYIHKVIGTTWGTTPGLDDDNNPLRKADRRSEGSSWFIRVHDDESTPAKKLDVRLGPKPLTDTLPSGVQRPARLPLYLGNDAIGAISDPTYIGAPNIEPELRTGLFSLENEEDISIVACPGQTGAQLQGALISHCEFMRYRFAVLDGPRPPNDSLNDAQSQRQNFDSKYAAFYHPWLVIPHPYPVNLAKIPDYPVPPSGHMIGIYARTDIERGVHKAPANEVVRGVIGLQRRLNKGEHDILNPYPVNINVIRDFRSNSRGIRVYGGRVITSDPDWKYVNVRRLLIFIEASINRGLQWVVFEPNAEPLWARVRRSISNFLTLVWRNGGLEGAKVEEAFFVKCDRTTMTQTDIDSGRLICVVGVAPVKPAEFVIVRIGLWTAHADD